MDDQHKSVEELPAPVPVSTAQGPVIIARSSSSKPSERAQLRSNSLECFEECDDKLRALLITLVTGSILEFISKNIPVFLDGFGILIPSVESRERVRTASGMVLVQNETFRTVRFEKCNELIAFHREKFGPIVDSREITDSLYVRLPDAVRSSHPVRSVRRIVQGIAQKLRRDVIATGSSTLLERLGVFFALHNRQGESETDWYAGSDIFLDPWFQRPLFIEPLRSHRQPIVQSSWELLEAAYGPPRATFTLRVVQQLTELGLDPTTLDREIRDSDREFPVAVFARKDYPATLIYCTDGLRNLAHPAADPAQPSVGSELIFQLGLSTEHGGSEIPTWPLRPLSMGWILLMSTRNRTLRPGAGLSCDVPLISNSDSELRNIFTTSFAPFRVPQQTSRGNFLFVNVVGITADEAQLAAEHGADFLQRLLRYKALDQHTKPGRSSIVARSYFAVTRIPEALASEGLPLASP